ncbi:MAG: hypothetical protein LBN08_03030 [Lactobacillales bacterium]|jgi:hypothetical protein|nr:hypothetical protein [Lactobacillales bacterium]
MKLNYNEALSHKTGLAKYCPGIQTQQIHITKFGVGRATAADRPYITIHKSKEPIETCTEFIKNERVMLPEYCFSQVCRDFSVEDITAAYVELMRGGYDKARILSHVPNRRLERDLAFLRGTPDKIESVREVQFYFKLRDDKFEMPKCNHTFFLNQHQHDLTNRWSIRPDFYWDRYNVAVEYQGEKGHFDSYKGIDRDHAKLSVYAEMGIKCFQLNKFIMDDPIRFKAFLKSLKSALR